MAESELAIEAPPVTLETPDPPAKKRRRRMPAQKPATSKQDYRTPENFLTAAKRKLGIEDFSLDVAADDTNAVCDMYYTVKENGLTSPWNPIHPTWGIPIEGWAWCNPEFGEIAKWVGKAYWESCNTGAAVDGEASAKSAVLVPAAVGANWWKEWVHGKARVLLLNGRLCFIHDWQHTIDPATLKPENGPPRFYTSAPLYPKDCVLLLYGPDVVPAYEVWTWGAEAQDPPIDELCQSMLEK